MTTLHSLPCLDSESMATARRRELALSRDVAAALGRSAVEAAQAGFYRNRSGQAIAWRDAVQAACAAKVSIPPEATLPNQG